MHAPDAGLVADYGLLVTRRGSGWRQTTVGVAVGAAAIADVSLLIAAIKQSANPVGLTGLYLVAILPVTTRWGFVAAGIVAVASYLTFAYFVAQPVHNFAIGRADTAVALAISLAAAYVVSLLAGRASERAREATVRAQEAEAAKEQHRQLADEQAALRRVATLSWRRARRIQRWSRGSPARSVCNAAPNLARLERLEPDRTVVEIAAWTRNKGELAVGSRFPLEGESIAARVLESGAPARIATFAGASGPIAREAQALGIRSSVGCPVIVGGRVWAVVAASMIRPTPFPPDTESPSWPSPSSCRPRLRTPTRAGS